ncbi:MAG TPA: pyridoxal-phosphate dependent enzyme [Chitinophagaceae bacterium]|nr:pyridoxal-phosphate dependent enzyme [Chitinophagaceae bacterium]
MQEISFQNITTDFISDPLFIEKNIEVAVLRLDKIHPVISGNKWFKLQFYIEEAIRSQKKTIVTFGGAWSNHIIATAAACKQKNLTCIGIIRGKQPAELSATLRYSKEIGMKLFFLDRNEYREKRIPDALKQEDYYFINEGGYGEQGAKGAEIILKHCDKNNFSHFCCAVGTGTMIAGLIRASSRNQQVIGISVLKNNFEIGETIKALLNDEQNFQLHHGYHFGGYAKYNNDLIRFMNEFYSRHHIPSDFVYTGKLFFAIQDLIAKNFFPSGSKILIIHSGGLQGNVSQPEGTLIF